MTQNDHDGYLIELALELGFQSDDDMETYTATEAQLLEFARRIEAICVTKEVQFLEFIANLHP